ncbi:hypothetical protein [Nonomuraea dietziae]|uniref:hypothetical protein n=1 Tax=Nonomuraea dietziae TaxID=65515 RepID=UPI0034241E6D
MFDATRKDAGVHQYVAQVEQTRRRRQPIEDLVGERIRTGGQRPQVGLHAGAHQPAHEGVGALAAQQGLSQSLQLKHQRLRFMQSLADHEDLVEIW